MWPMERQNLALKQCITNKKNNDWINKIVETKFWIHEYDKCKIRQNITS